MNTACAVVEMTPATKAARNFDNKRVAREWKTIQVMVHLNCHGHQDSGPWRECQQLLDYVWARLEGCRFGSQKPVCAVCSFHCFESSRREQLQAIVSRVGPRMFWRYPWLSLRQWLDGYRHVPMSAVQMDCGSWGAE